MTTIEVVQQRFVEVAHLDGSSRRDRSQFADHPACSERDIDPQRVHALASISGLKRVTCGSACDHSQRSRNALPHQPDTSWLLDDSCDISDPAHPLRLPRRSRQVAQHNPQRQSSGHDQRIESLLRWEGALRGAKQCQRLDHPPQRQPRAPHGANLPAGVRSAGRNATYGFRPSRTYP